MATVQDISSENGKTGGMERGGKCDLCDNLVTSKYCTECEAQLCKTCSTAHGRLLATKGHALLDIGITSAVSETGPNYCKKHANEKLECYCKECESIICEECKKSHGGHSVQVLTDDVKLYQSICTKHIKSLLDKTNDLQEHKALIEGIFTSYDEAIEMVKIWEKELKELLVETSVALIEDLKISKQPWKALLNDKTEGLIKTMSDVENEISNLNQVRKLTNTDVFSHELVASQQLLDYIQNFQDRILPSLTVKRIEDLLPGTPNLSVVKSGILDLMTSERKNEQSTPEVKGSEENMISATPSTPTCGDKSTVQNCDSMCKQKTIRLRNHIIYKFIKSMRQGELMVFGRNTKIVFIMDLDGREIEFGVQAECKIFDIVSTDPDEYVAIGKENLHLLNYNMMTNKLEIAHTRLSIGYICKCVFNLTSRRFVFVEVREKNERCELRISIVKIKGGRFDVERWKSIDFPTYVGAMVTDEEGMHAYMSVGACIYKVNLHTWSRQQITVHENLLGSILCMASGHLLYHGYLSGEIRLYDKNLTNSRVFLNLPDRPMLLDMAMINGNLAVITMDGEIILYK